MQDQTFMYGDLATLNAKEEPVMTVLLIGFQGQTRLLTGTRAALWNEYLHGDGGHGCNGVRPVGWEYWCPQPLLTTDTKDAVVSPKIAEILSKKGS